MDMETEKEDTKEATFHLVRDDEDDDEDDQIEENSLFMRWFQGTMILFQKLKKSKQDKCQTSVF